MIETYGAAPMVADSLGYSYNLISDIFLFIAVIGKATQL